MESVLWNRPALPVLHSCDVVVAGGSLAGVAAALTLARAGHSVTLVERRTYLAADIMATLRPWIHVADLPVPDPIVDLIRATNRVDEAKGLKGEYALRPDAVKLRLEDLLLQAGVELLYASLPTGLVTGPGGQVRGLVVGNKSGRQVLACHSVIDATETAAVARAAGVPIGPETALSARFRRTIEFDSVEATPETTLQVPAELGIADNTVYLRRGHLGWAHLYVEFGLDLPVPEAGLSGAMQRELEARERSMRLASHLLHNELPFYWARLTATSYELHGRHTSSMLGGTPEWAADAEPLSIEIPRNDGASHRLELGSFATPTPHLWCLQEAARLSPEHYALFQDPVPAFLLGEAVAKGVVRYWNQVPPSSLTDEAARTPTLRVESTAADGAVASVTASLPLQVKEPGSPQQGRPYSWQPMPDTPVPVLHRTQVLVVGGGTSGAVASIASAREGARTTLLEMNPGLGGTATLGGVDSYWMSRQVGFVPLIKEAVEEVHRSLRYLYQAPGFLWNLEAKMHALLKEAVGAGVEVVLGAVCIGTIVEGDQVRGVVAATPYGPFAILADVVVDATGDGDVAFFAGASHIYGSERDRTTMWYSLPQFGTPGRNRNNFSGLVDVSNVKDYTRAILAGRRRTEASEQSQFRIPADPPGIHDHGVYVAPRETRHILSDVVLTLTDQLVHRKWPDVVLIAFSNYDVKGKSDSEWISLGMIPPNLEIEIPYGSLLPKGLERILVTGKAISAKSYALPSIRMQPDMENLGGVAGLAAAMAAKQGRSPRQLSAQELQQRLVAIGLLPDRVLTRKLRPRSYSDAELESLIENLSAAGPLYTLSNQRQSEVYRERIPMVEVCTVGERAVPLLRRALETAQGDHRTLIAQALAFYGSADGVPALIDRIDRALAGDELPARTAFIANSNLAPPDQGAMPEAAYLIYTLGMARNTRSLAVWERVVDLLDFDEDDLWHYFRAPFFYVDAVCYGAERLGDPRAIPILQKMHAHPLLRNQYRREVLEPNFVQERQALLELAIGRALARCGSPDGYQILIAYLDDTRALLAEQAHSELGACAQVSLPKDPSAWNDWLQRHRDSLVPRPFLGRLDVDWGLLEDALEEEG